MYSLNPVVALPKEIPLPKDVMYNLPKIQGDDSKESKLVFLDEHGRQEFMDHEVDDVECTQLLILKELHELKAEIEYLWIAVRLSDIKKVTPYVRDTPEYIGIIREDPVDIEIVLYANPNKPPYFIAALQRLWPDVHINVKIHQHSTITDKVSNKFEELLSNTKKIAKHNIDVKIIWKNVRNINLVTEFYNCPLEGETIILRYLSRLIEKYNYEDPKSLENTNQIDSVFDLCSFLSDAEPKSIHIVIDKLTSILQDSKWFSKSVTPSIIDVALWSCIRQFDNLKFNQKLKSWYTLCEKTFLSKQ